MNTDEMRELEKHHPGLMAIIAEVDPKHHALLTDDAKVDALVDEIMEDEG